jgi:multidrug efflux pump subunit AcrB
VLHQKIFSLFLALLLFAASLYYFQKVGLSFFPKAEKPILMVEIETPYGSRISFTDSVTRKVEALLREEPLVVGTAVNVGHGNPKIYYSHFPVSRARDMAEIYVPLKYYEAEEVSQLKTSLRKKFGQIPGAKIKVYEFAQGPPTDNPIAFRLNGEDLDVLKEIAFDIEALFDETPGLRDIKNNSKNTITSLEVNVNKAKAGMLGVMLNEINQTLRIAIDGAEISQFSGEDGNRYDILLRLKDSKSLSAELFDKLYVNSVTGAQVPLDQLAQVEFKTQPYLVKHYNFERSTMVSADAEDGYNVNALTNQLIRKINEYDFPEGYSYVVAGEKEKLGQSLQGIGIAAAIAIIGIFSVLVLQFRSFKQPLIIFSALPFAIIGSVFTLLLLGMNFSFTAFVGLTSLIGIVVNDSIILIDFANQARREGKEKLEAVKEAGVVRFIPIILTTLTTVGGLLPLTLRGGTLWAPMGWTIIGGLLVSTFLILFIVPVLYMVYSDD